jgi:alkylation response protein AidB-like acyl-CoA dehydrogenase
MSDGRVTGSLGIVPDGDVADAIVVALDDGGVVLIDGGAPGVTRHPVRLVDGTGAAELQFEGTPAVKFDVDDADLARALALADLAIASELVGTMATLLDHAVEYVKQRRQFGQPIGSFQAVQHRCARMYTLLEQSRSMVLKAALAEEHSRQHAVTCAKAYVGDAALQLSEDAVQLHGGMGVTDELAVGRALRRVLLLSRLFGGSAAARAELAG